MGSSPTPAVCPECGDTFQDLRGLNGHMRFKHDLTPEEVRQELANAQKENRAADMAGELLDLMDQLEEIEEQKERAEKRRRKARGLLSVKTDKEMKKAAEVVLEKLEEKEEKVRKRIRKLTGKKEKKSSGISWLK